MSTQTIGQRIPAGNYSLDPVHSSLDFAVAHNGVSAFRSGFDSYAANLEGGASPRLEGTVEVDSVRVGDAQLKGHLLSPEFFGAERHPRLRFVSSAVEVGEDGVATVRGELEIRGEKREVEARGRIVPLEGDLAGQRRVLLSLAASVDRREFGLAWQAQLPSGVDVLDWTVEIAVELQFVAAADGAGEVA